MSLENEPFKKSLLGFWTMFKYGSFLHDRALVGICRRHGGLFTDSGFCKYSWAHLVMSMTESCRWVMKYRLRTQGPQASNKGLRPSPLRTEISSVSLNILMMLFTFTFTFMHLADAFIQSDLQLHSGYTFFISMCVPWESNPQPFALLTQCSTTEPHRNTLCTVDDDICKAFAISHWGTLLFKYSIIFLRPLSQIGEPLPIFTSEWLPL